MYTYIVQFLNSKEKKCFIMKKTPKKILIMGLPGAGKTTLAEKFAPMINAVRINADEVRKMANDWDFSLKGRLRQSKRMKDLAQKALNEGRHVVADFVCPTPDTRKDFKEDDKVGASGFKPNTSTGESDFASESCALAHIPLTEKASKAEYFLILFLFIGSLLV